MKTEIAVVGAGAIGLTVAYELVCRGHQVTLVERDRVPAVDLPTDSDASAANAWDLPRGASSWAASGILPPANPDTATDPIDRLRGMSHRRFPGLAERLLEETGIDCQLRRCGGWYLSDSAGETAAMVGMVQYWRELSIECEPIDLNQCTAREPILKDWCASVSSAKAWWVPDEYTVCTPRLLAALALACVKRGVQVVDQRVVTGIDEGDRGVRVRLARRSIGSAFAADQKTDQIELVAEQLAVCGGVWSGLIDPALRLTQSLVPVRGQILLLRQQRQTIGSVINLGNRYLVPRENGDVLVGSCEEEVGLQHGTTPDKLQQLRQFAHSLCPTLKSAREVAAWSGLRPLTFDGFPMCGKLPDSRAIYLATGHFRSGIHLSPATAICLADLMTGQTPPIAMDDFRVGKQQHSFDG